MKKILISLSIILISATLLVSCTNPTKVLPKKTWSYSASMTTVTTGAVNSSTPGTDAGTATFKSDGTGTMQSSSSGSAANSFTWSYDKSGKKMTLTMGSDVYVYDVTETKAKEEKWHGTATWTLAGTTYTVTEDLTLTAQ